LYGIGHFFTVEINTYRSIAVLQYSFSTSIVGINRYRPYAFRIRSDINDMQSDFDTLEPKDRFKIVLDRAKFIIPTLKAVEFGNILDEMNEDDFKVLIEKLKHEYSLS